MNSRGSPIGLAVNPEFLREGRALEDFLQPDRIVIGELDVRSGDALAKLYETFGVPIIRTNSATAEMIKYTSNALLATLISFSNEIARVCESVPGVDVEDVLNTVHLDRRLTQVVDGRRVSAGINHYLKAGCGYGGSCLPKDLRALIAFARERGVESGLLKAVQAVNESQPVHFVDLAESWAGGLSGKQALVLGLSFKDGTDDIRESTGVAVARNLLERGASVTMYDPLVKKAQVMELLRLGAEFVDEPVSAFRCADVCFITTSAPEFKFVETVLDPTSPGTKQTMVVDGRRILSRGRLSAGNSYIATGIGLPYHENRTMGRWNQ
jgi:nucleotide sugar dehydrogenase